MPYKNKTRSTAKIRPDALIEETNEAAYWLGFLMADGSVSSTTNEIRLKLGIKDYDHLKKFTEYLGLPSERCRTNEKEALVTFSDRKVKDTLTMYGIGPQKTFSAEVKSTYLMKNRFFWAGFIDGDGSIHQGVPNKNQIRFSLSAVSGSYKLIAQFKDFIFAETKISLTITAVNKKSPNYVFSLGGKKAIRVMQLLYSDNPYALSRKSELARIAANRYAVDLDGDIIDWRTATGYDHIWFEKNPRVINRKYRVTGPNDIHIGSFSDLETAILARDYFYELLANELNIKEAKTKVIERFEEYFPRSYYAAESAVRYDKKRQVYICRLYYQTRIPGKKGMDIYILEHANKQLVQAVDAIAKNLRQAGYVYEGRRARIEQGGFLYEHSIPQNWKNILIEHGVPDKKITGLEETIISVWNNISPLN